MTTEPTTRTIPDDALIYLPLPHPLGMAAVYGEREGMVSAADLSPTPNDLNDPATYYAWTAEVARVFAERGVLDASRRDREASLLVSRCPHWCPGRHAMADVELGGIDHSITLLDLGDGGRVDVSAYQSRDRSMEEPTITLSRRRTTWSPRLPSASPLPLPLPPGWSARSAPRAKEVWNRSEMLTANFLMRGPRNRIEVLLTRNTSIGFGTPARGAHGGAAGVATGSAR